MRALYAAVTLLVACDGATSDPGLEALLQVEGAQYRPGAFPTPTGGPAALSVFARRSRVTVGRMEGVLSGVLEPGARGAIFGIEGIDGAWILPAGLPELDTPDAPSPRARFGLADDFPPGPFELLVAGSDAEGRIGESARTTIVADAEPPPDGTLVIGLYWQGRADLDIHVTDPLGGTAWSDDPNTYEPPKPGEAPDPPGAHLAGGILDRDGNRACAQDGSPREHVVWRQPPPPGKYTVRVDARSLCGDPVAYWHVVAEQRDIAMHGNVRGVSTSADVNQPHDAAAGTLALEFEVRPEP